MRYQTRTRLAEHASTWKSRREFEKGFLRIGRIGPCFSVYDWIRTIMECLRKASAVVGDTSHVSIRA